MKTLLLLAMACPPALASQCAIPLRTLPVEPPPNSRTLTPDVSKMAPMPEPALPAPPCAVPGRPLLAHQLPRERDPREWLLRRQTAPRPALKLVDPLPGPIEDKK
ncbi:MAG: hypothetical protein SFV54_21250 [Bryobacteraceae bacterium]|nr:hypothetical protein [Bryobacteraceae bacterium]